MPATAENLRDLHQLHQRARALQDRLSSGPKTLAARQVALNARQAELETARKALQDAKIGIKKHEHSLQAVESKIDDSKVKLNQAKKNEEYKAHQNQIAHDSATKSKLEEQILQAMEVIETKTSEFAKLEADVKRFTEELAAFRKQVEEQSVAHKSQLRELETAITGAEIAIPDDFREQYRRIVSRYGADALAVCEDGAASPR
jgi:predicted  nucleic acid-binding Zn-ribbon protein